MRILSIIAIVLGACFCTVADQFVYVRDGKVASAPRELPSCGVDGRTGEVVLGLHGAAEAQRAACGWYRVIPSKVALASNQVVRARSYMVGKTSVQEVLTVDTRKTRTVRERMAAVFASPELAAMTEEARCAAVIGAVAQVVTQRLEKAVMVTIPGRVPGNQEVSK